jgi:carboxypeptidase Q
VSKIKNGPAAIGYVPDDQRYFDLHHSAADVFETVHPREFELGSAAITILAYLISEEGLHCH